MHEFSIALNIVDICENTLQKEGGKKITEIDIEAGQYSGVVVDALELAMQQAVKNTNAENCTVNIIDIPGIIHCNNCNSDFENEYLYAPCPLCNETNTEIKKGKELRVKSIEIE